MKQKQAFAKRFNGKSKKSKPKISEILMVQQMQKSSISIKSFDLYISNICEFEESLHNLRNKLKTTGSLIKGIIIYEKKIQTAQVNESNAKECKSLIAEYRELEATYQNAQVLKEKVEKMMKEYKDLCNIITILNDFNGTPI